MPALGPHSTRLGPQLFVILWSLRWFIFLLLLPATASLGAVASALCPHPLAQSWRLVERCECLSPGPGPSSVPKARVAHCVETAVAASEDRADKRQDLQFIQTPEGAFIASPFLWKIGKPLSENLDFLGVPGLPCQV